MGLFLSSIIITGVGTSLIILRILSATRENPSIGNLAPYRRIQRIVVESGIVYLLGLVITGVPLAIARHIVNPPPSRSATPVFLLCSVILTYSQALLIPLAVGLCSRNYSYLLIYIWQGIAPTLIAFGVVTQTPDRDNDGSQPISHLTFRRSVRRNYTRGVDSLVTVLHLESTLDVGDSGDSLQRKNL